MKYTDFFESLANRPASKRVVSLAGGLSVALESIQQEGTRFHLRLLVGDPSETPILFDESTGASRPSEIAGGQWLASATRAVVETDTDIRVVALEIRRNGIGASTLERVLEEMGSTDLNRLKFDLNPLPSKSFIEEIDRFERIREATLVVARPNYDWDDHNDRLHELAKESGAAKAESTVTAPRSESLNRSKGLVGYIKLLAQAKVSDVKNAIVRGTRTGESAETSVSLERNVLSGRVEFDSRLSIVEQDSTIWGQESALIDELLPRASMNDDGQAIEAE